MLHAHAASGAAPPRRWRWRSPITSRCRSPGSSTAPARPTACSRGSTRSAKSPGHGAEFLIDLNGPVYILDKKTKTLRRISTSTGATAAQGLFRQARVRSGLRQRRRHAPVRSRTIARNGRFYTVHLEDPALEGVGAPDNTQPARLQCDGLFADERRSHARDRWSAKAC